MAVVVVISVVVNKTFEKKKQFKSRRSCFETKSYYKNINF